MSALMCSHMSAPQCSHLCVVIIIIIIIIVVIIIFIIIIIITTTSLVSFGPPTLFGVSCRDNLGEDWGRTCSVVVLYGSTCRHPAPYKLRRRVTDGNSIPGGMTSMILHFSGGRRWKNMRVGWCFSLISHDFFVCWGVHWLESFRCIQHVWDGTDDMLHKTSLSTPD